VADSGKNVDTPRAEIGILSVIVGTTTCAKGVAVDAVSRADVSGRLVKLSLFFFSSWRRCES